MSTSPERTVDVESVRVTTTRSNYGVLSALGASIRDEGMRHPITLWKDGTLVSGGRRHRAHLLLGGKHRQIQAVFVDTIEDAAKNLLRDNEDDYLALPVKWTEVCRLWEMMRRLDAPAAVKRADALRRRGVELRRMTQAGKRKPGRVNEGRYDDYVLHVLSGPFGVSETTAKRLWMIYSLACDPENERREQARAALGAIDAGESSIWANYRMLTTGRIAPVSRLTAPAAVEAAPAARQRAAWDRSLPQMEGLVAGLIELGPPNAELTWEQVGPVAARLAAVRRDLEKIIKKMRENNQP